MNRHFQDARYYLKRAGETAKKGIAKELEPVHDRYLKLTGREPEPEPTRLEDIKADLREVQMKAKGEARAAIAEASEKIESYRENQTA